MTTDQIDLPAHSPEAEQGVLGCLLIDSNLIHDLASKNVTPDWFYVHANRIVFDAIRILIERRTPIDLITLGQHLQVHQQLEGIGGHAYLSAAIDSVPSAANLPYYVEILKEKTAERRITAACAAITQDSRAGIPPSLDRIEAALADARSVGASNSGGMTTAKSAFLKFGAWIQDRINNVGNISGVPTGITRLDHMLDGIQFSEMTLFAARPSVGKTALGCCVTAAAVDAGIPTLFVTAEMSDKMIMRRLVSNRGSVPMDALKKGTLNEREYQQCAIAGRALSDSPLFFEEQIGGDTIGRLIASIRFAVSRHAVRFVVIDYLQKYKGDSKREKKTEELGEVCEKLQKLTRETGISILALAQLNRENEKDKKTRVPKLTDLGDSKELENHADAVVLIHRDRASSGEAELIVAKQRDGECGSVKVHFDGKFCRFANLHPTIDPTAA